MKVLPVLYINLAGDTDRRAHIEDAPVQDNLELIRIRALEPPFALPNALFSDALSVGEIGCYASHMKAWDMLLVSGRPHALVLEDDARVPQNLAELVDTMISVLPEHWDLVHLYDNDCHPSRPLRAIGADHELVRYSRVPGGCVGYLISRSGAQKLRRQELRCWPLDTGFRRPWHFLLDSYGIRPPLVEHDSGFPSTILKRGPRSRKRRGIALSSPLHSLQGAVWNMRKLGLRWWLQCFAINSRRRIWKAVGKLAYWGGPQPEPLPRVAVGAEASRCANPIESEAAPVRAQRLFKLGPSVSAAVSKKYFICPPHRTPTNGPVDARRGQRSFRSEAGGITGERADPTSVWGANKGRPSTGDQLPSKQPLGPPTPPTSNSNLTSTWRAQNRAERGAMRATG